MAPRERREKKRIGKEARGEAGAAEEWARAGRASAQRLVARFSLLCPVPEECAQSGVGGRNATRRDVIIFSLRGSKGVPD